ncbi:hypothetical protein OAE24_07125 [Candidatus Thioglobus sp.]|nr:hypothetical protein [Candidatus Thioglobus sp.]
MKKLLQELFEISCVIVGLFVGYLLIKHIWSVFDISPTGTLFFILALFTYYVWLSRNYKYGLYRLFKDTHQSNLDDIEQQQLEEQIDQAIVKEQFKTSLETVALVSLILYLLICGVLFIFVSDLGLVNWLILLSVIPIILIYGFLKDKIPLTLKNMPKNNN